MGTGLGLSIVWNLIRMMGGTIHVTSQVGQGTEFVIELEFLIAAEAVVQESWEAEQQAMPSYDFSGRTVLLVEDNEVNSDIATLLLQKVGFRVEHAANGQEAIERFSSHREEYYDAILMDIRMPVMNGLQATAAIRAMQRTDALTIPIIAMTANAFEEDVENSRKAGMNVHLTKPIDRVLLYRTLAQWMNQR